jgi:hypothetical protein
MFLHDIAMEQCHENSALITEHALKLNVLFILAAYLTL